MDVSENMISAKRSTVHSVLSRMPAAVCPSTRLSLPPQYRAMRTRTATTAATDTRKKIPASRGTL